MRTLPPPLAVLVAVAAAACAPRPERVTPESDGRGDYPTSARRVGVLAELNGPESVRYDPELDVLYVSNMWGYGSAKDHHGYIVRVPAGDLRAGRILAQGGVNGVTLHAPKGMAVQGDTLWVADIDVLRGFHRSTGAPVAAIDFSPHRPTLLNDVAAGPGGTLRVTDTGIIMSDRGVIFDVPGDRIFVVGADRSIREIPAGLPYPKPNGISWDGRGRRWLVVTFDPFASKLYAMPPDDTARTVVSAGKGRWDGVEALADGRVLLSSWTDSSIHLVTAEGRRPIIRHVPAAADIGVDTRRGHVLVPLPLANRVEVWSLPAER